MSDTSTMPSGMTGGGEALRALRLMVRKSASAGISVAPTSAGIELHGKDANGAAWTAIISEESWLLWRTKDWVCSINPSTSELAAKSESALWRLSAKGREQVRRLLSSGQVPAPAVTPVAKHPSAARSERPGFNPNESPVAWLASRRDRDGKPMISREQLAAAERLRADFWFAGMSPRVTTNWSATGGASGGRVHGSDMSDNALAASMRVRHAMAAAGPEFQSMLFDVCCLLIGLETVERKAGWPQRSGKVVLQLALNRLARHYGLLPPAGDTSRPRNPIRHWGSEDYRPGSGDHNDAA